jgi:hypothetical protein
MATGASKVFPVKLPTRQERRPHFEIGDLLRRPEEF